MLPAFDEDCCPLGDLHAEVAGRFRSGDQTAAMPPSRALLKPPNRDVVHAALRSQTRVTGAQGILPWNLLKARNPVGPPGQATPRRGSEFSR